MEHHVYFAVFGFDHDPAQLDLMLGQSADDYWRVGDTYSDLVPEARRRENRWILSSQLDRDASHRDHFEKLLRKLQTLAGHLPQLEQHHYRFGIGVSQYFFMDDPAFYLPAELIDGFRALGFEIRFDQLGLDERA
ncbi:hypothetical protein A11A3_11097 [Alcanivorax hongdengensis A-11-3]|uniref:DUF4279 domain-containing protein n=1 Tax=Alcanivorax hongdengensis A-11-3 TaxID=1177179 RepID=L0WA95_9GAMM|nr:DUF4279 domain-containing protein [Alcanivorax hongdengensis]EKF73899.1 hypothetical protein A11A3_11097 [Alcanivorax hongdengensis A-11-3]